MFKLKLIGFCLGLVLFACKSETKKEETVAQSEWVNLLTEPSIIDLGIYTTKSLFQITNCD